jgi:hypothetical protein
MEKPKRLRKNFLENVITQIANDSLPEIRDRIDRTVFGECFYRRGDHKKEQQNSPVECRNVQPRIDEWNRDGRRRGSAQQRIEDQTD